MNNLIFIFGLAILGAAVSLLYHKRFTHHTLLGFAMCMLMAIVISAIDTKNAETMVTDQQTEKVQLLPFADGNYIQENQENGKAESYTLRFKHDDRIDIQILNADEVTELIESVKPNAARCEIITEEISYEYPSVSKFFDFPPAKKTNRVSRSLYQITVPSGTIKII